jgi:2-polyprenyl-3-methyl-5-hydroxy-6-metoxy-1,4-benzoquinol methylase
MTSCADLFSKHYGRWGAGGLRPGEPITIPPEHVRRLLDSEQAHIVCAFDGSTLAGYSIVLRFDAGDGRRVAWIAQLVVHPTYRQSRVATTLLFSAWQFSDYDVWGLVTANPYAVRALETATRRPCRAKLIVEDGRPILQDLHRYLGYLPADFDSPNKKALPSVDTKFPIDLSELEDMKDKAARASRPWNLGSIVDGHEWFAATFSSQAPSVARGDYLNELLEGVDAIWVRAYEGMTLDTDHAWHRHGAGEVAWVLGRSGLEPPARVLDAGCGDGRHSLILAQRGFDVRAVDISARLVDRATQLAASAGVSVDVSQADLRNPDEVPTGAFDLVLALYDVIGSSANPSDDRAILANLRSRTSSSGLLCLSVMNAASTLPYLLPEHRPESEEAFVAALEKLPPSREMERSGAVFNAALIVHFEGRFYRKEQFDRAVDLPPSELIIRDRRFAADEIAHLVTNAGFRELLGVRAGAWDVPLDPNSPEAKEILVMAQVAE